MAEALTFIAPRQVTFTHLEDRPLRPREVRVKTLYSGISAGTELTHYRGSNVYIHKRWDAVRRLFLSSDAPTSPYPVVGTGYEEVGQVIETGAEVARVKTGDILYGTWGHRTHHILEEDYAAQRIKPEALDPILAIFSHIGPIALNGILDANIHIGENVAVFGLGVPGQITAQLAKRSGARVIGVDPIPSRLKLAHELGSIDVALNPTEGSPAEKIKEITGGRGVDSAIEVSGHIAALGEAIRATAYSARVIALGFFQGEAEGLLLGEEFHHNRVQIICSQIANVDPMFSYRWDRLRLVHTIMSLQLEGQLNLRPVISHIIPFHDGAEAFWLLDHSPAEALQIVLEFPKGA
jgi:threonine dehydrogenase-like Zn-dependent dehydrogenase